MIKAYINLPDPDVTIHGNPNCASARVQKDENPRHLIINADNLSKELSRFKDNKHQFATVAGKSDMWLVLDFNDVDFETALAGYVMRLVGLRHSPSRKCGLRVHC